MNECLTTLVMFLPRFLHNSHVGLGREGTFPWQRLHFPHDGSFDDGFGDPNSLGVMQLRFAARHSGTVTWTIKRLQSVAG